MKAGTQAYSLLSSDEALALEQPSDIWEKTRFWKAPGSTNFGGIWLPGISFLLFCISILIFFISFRYQPSDVICAQRMAAPCKLLKTVLKLC
jgi:hypothetical protein